MPKTEFLQIRLSPEDRARVERAAAAQHLSPSTWARQSLLLVLERLEAPQSDASNAPAARGTSHGISASGELGGSS